MWRHLLLNRTHSVEFLEGLNGAEIDDRVAIWSPHGEEGTRDRILHSMEQP